MSTVPAAFPAATATTTKTTDAMRDHISQNVDKFSVAKISTNFHEIL